MLAEHTASAFDAVELNREANPQVVIRLTRESGLQSGPGELTNGPREPSARTEPTDRVLRAEQLRIPALLSR